MSWRTRKRGTSKQIGQKFPVMEKKKLPAKISAPIPKKKDLELEIEELMKKFKEEDKVEEQKMLVKGYPYVVDYWIHPISGGDDRQMRAYFKREPTEGDIANLLKKSVIKNDYKVKKIQSPKPAKVKVDKWYSQYEKDMKTKISQKVKKTKSDAKYPVSERGPSYQRYLEKQRDKRKKVSG